MKPIEQELKQLSVKRKVHLSLDNVFRAAALLGNPQNKLRFIHIAGTNGKGTTADFIAQLLEQSGYKTALYTSPHFISYTERFVINGKQVSSDRLGKLYKQVATKTKGIKLTEFEILTLIGLIYFLEEKVDYVVWETGLGGRLDATNIVTPLISVITTISFDHCEFLGNNLLDIAREKAGIIKPGIPVIFFRQQPVVENLLVKESSACKSIYKVVNKGTGNFLQSNKRLALEAATILLPDNRRQLREISRKLKTRIKGRLQVIRKKPLLLLDSAHNMEGINNLVNFIKKKYGNNLMIIYAATRREEIKKIVKNLQQVAEKIFICEFRHDRAVSIGEYVDKYAISSPQLEFVPGRNMKSFIKKITGANKNICITGSIYFLGEVMMVLEQKPET